MSCPEVIDVVVFSHHPYRLINTQAQFANQTNDEEENWRKMRGITKQRTDTDDDTRRQLQTNTTARSQCFGIQRFQWFCYFLISGKQPQEIRSHQGEGQTRPSSVRARRGGALRFKQRRRRFRFQRFFAFNQLAIALRHHHSLLVYIFFYILELEIYTSRVQSHYANQVTKTTVVA